MVFIKMWCEWVGGWVGGGLPTGGGRGGGGLIPFPCLGLESVTFVGSTIVWWHDNVA
jgi:hypothetical protein